MKIFSIRQPFACLITRRGPKRRLRDVCYSAAVGDKPTSAERAATAAFDPQRSCAAQVFRSAN
jgi:hypothetical protein